MTWEKIDIYIPKYEYVSTNQHGDRYRRVTTKRIDGVRLTTDVGDAKNLRDLILFSHFLKLPVHYDFKTDPQTAYIEVIGREAILV